MNEKKTQFENILTFLMENIFIQLKWRTFQQKVWGFLFPSKFRMKQNFKIVIYPVTFLCFEQF